MRIAIVNDMPLAIEALRRVLALAPQHQLAWTALDGEEAVELCRRDRPDLVLMDLVMPRMDGVEATRRIMAHTPCAILIVTADIETNAARVFSAMGEGAIDAIDTPLIGRGDPKAGAQPLLAKITAIARLIDEGSNGPSPIGRKPASADRLVAIGASAGGPAALAAVLQSLPASFPAAVVIVQHVDARFAPGLATWLGQHSALPVRLAREGDRVQPGSVLVAGTDDHLVFKSQGRLGYTSTPADHAYRPSVDVFFKSAARFWNGPLIGVLLTGMGSDGAQGLKAFRELGHDTIAQDRATSAVYGMPKAAAALGAAADILPLENIATRLTELLGSYRPRRGIAI
jgi:two-component system response regulator WspF